MPGQSVHAVLTHYFNGNTDHAYSSNNSVSCKDATLLSYKMPIAYRFSNGKAEDVYVIVGKGLAPTTTTTKHITQAIEAAKQSEALFCTVNAQLHMSKFNVLQAATTMRQVLLYELSRLEVAGNNTEDMPRLIAIHEDKRQVMRVLERIDEMFPMEAA